MPDVNIGQMGHKKGVTPLGELKSTPKLTKINGDDFMSLIYRNMGNNHAYPMVWMQQLDVTFSGTTVVVASGTKFHGMEAADYVNLIVTPQGDPGGYWYVTNDTVAKTISITNTGGNAVTFNVMFMLGEAPTFGGIGGVATVSGIKNKPMLHANVYFTGQSLP